MPDRPLAVVPPAARRSPAPSKAAWHEAHPTIGVSVAPAQRDAIAAAAQAAGTTMGAHLLGGHERAAAAEARLRHAQAAHRTQLAALKRDHAAALTAANQQAQVAVAAAEARGRTQADPDLRAAAAAALRAAQDWQAGFALLLDYFGERGDALLRGVTDPARSAATARWLDAQERTVDLQLAMRAVRPPLPREFARELAAARDEGRREGASAGRAAARREVATAETALADHTQELAAATVRTAELERTLTTAQGRIADLEAVVAGVDAEALAERARRDPSDWLLRLSAAAAGVKAQPRLAAVAARHTTPEPAA